MAVSWSIAIVIVARIKTSLLLLSSVPEPVTLRIVLLGQCLAQYAHSCVRYSDV